MISASNSSLSRRQLLGALAVLVSGASGCTTAETQETASSTRAVTEQRAFTTCLTTPPTVQVHNAGGEPAVRSSAVSPAGGWERTHWLVTSPSEREALEYAPDTTGVGGAEQFFEMTDRSAQNVLIHQQTFAGCRSIKLEQLLLRADDRTRSGGFEVGLEYGDGENNGRCSDEDSQYSVATMVRVPADITDITRFTTGTVNIGPDDC